MSLKIRATHARRTLAVGVSTAALATAQSVYAQAAPCPGGSPGPICVITVEGDSGAIVGTNGNVTAVLNSGTITGEPAISQGGGIALYVDNDADGTITGTGGTAIVVQPRLIAGVDNSGIINGNVVFNDAPAQNIFGGSLVYFISDGGTLNGDLLLGTTGFTTAHFVQRGNDDGVTGTINAGAGLDVYSRSYSSSQAVTLGTNVLPASFEIEGFEVRDSAATVTLSGTGTSINLSGKGNVVNNGTVNSLNAAPFFPPGVVVIPAAITYYQY